MERLSFLELIARYSVIIPMIQRDYAYGRFDEEEKRNNFLTNLKSYFDEPDGHELDFIYGSVDENKNLVLLDGQQRVTTLFLLHWYLSLIRDETGKHHFREFHDAISASNGESKFSYRTRFSAKDFCDSMIKLEFLETDDYIEKYADLIENRSTKLSETIIREKWFLSHWNCDPTITSMLTMLDAIMQIFDPQKCKQYYKKLVNSKCISFNFLDLKDYGLTDELYIKMNSRGRELTRLENLKSKLLKLYDDAEEKVPEKYKMALSKINSTQESGVTYRSMRAYVSSMIDGKWTDVFWNEWLSSPDKNSIPNVDEMMLCFITNMSIFEHILYRLDGKLSLTRTDDRSKEINELMKAKDKSKGITIRYERLIDLFKENDYALLFKIIDYFNIFNDRGKLKAYLPASFRLFSEREEFNNLINDYKNENKMDYERKAKMFAYIKYLSQNPNPDEDLLVLWMRFVCNVCSNSYGIADRTDTYCTAISGLNYLYDRDITTSLQKKNLSQIAVLDISQIEEEILKIKLSKNARWKETLENAECKLEYFEGRLRYPLIECCSVSAEDVENTDKICKFNHYVDKMATIFPDSNGCRFEIELIRALLSKGDYLLTINYNKSLLKNADRDNSWKRFLKEKTGDAPDKRDYFRRVIDDEAFDVKDAKNSLIQIARKRSDSIPMWRKMIIDKLEIISNGEIATLGRDRFIRWNSDSTQFDHKKDTDDNYEIDLVSRTAISSAHAELFTLCKYYDIKDKFETISYCMTSTKVEQPYFCLRTNSETAVNVYYQDNNLFRFVFSDGREETEIASADIESRLQMIYH